MCDLYLCLSIKWETHTHPRTHTHIRTNTPPFLLPPLHPHTHILFFHLPKQRMFPFTSTHTTHFKRFLFTITTFYYFMLTCTTHSPFDDSITFTHIMHIRCDDIVTLFMMATLLPPTQHTLFITVTHISTISFYFYPHTALTV
jgi:hypothetical protein